MDERSQTEPMNFGKYSIVIPDESSNLQVGSFWRRLKAQQAGKHNSSDEVRPNPTHKRTTVIPPINTASPRASPRVKHLRNSITSPPMSSDPDITSSLPSDTSSSAVASKRNDIRTKSNTDKSDRAIVINDQNDDNATSYKSPITQSSTTDTSISLVVDSGEETHESFVVSLDPANFTFLENSNGPASSSYTFVDRAEDHSPYIPHIPKRIRIRTKTYPKQMPYDKIMSGVVFVLSGYENPRRARIRDLAIKMGAKYQPAWTRFSTHLICAFKNTPKYKEVMAENGRIVREHFILECSKQRQKIDWRHFKLGNYPYPDSEEEEDDLDCNLETEYYIKRQKTTDER